MKFGKIFALICVFVFSTNLVSVAAAKESEAVVSHGINVVSQSCYVALSCVSDSVLTFEAEDFERALNLSYVPSLTVTSLPSRGEGVLYLGQSEVQEGQTISRANIGYLNFEFAGETNKSSFCFSTGYSAYEIECNLYSLKYTNSAPVVDYMRTVETSTYKNVSLYGKLYAYDDEGDKVIFEVVKQPENGLLKLSSRGDYVYIPTKGFVGNDRFEYVALDEYGNYSQSRGVTLKVEQQNASLVFCDISDDEYQVAAINLAEKGIMNATEVDGKYYFYPDSKLGRLEYLVMAMKNCGIEIDNTSTPTVFSDDSEIPESLKGYVNTAVKLGIVCGKINSEGALVFAPNEKITLAEAAVMLDNMTEFSSPVLAPVFADSNSLPAWSKDAIYRLSYNNILPDKGGYVFANDSLNRENGAYMLYMIGKALQEK